MATRFGGEVPTARRRGRGLRGTDQSRSFEKFGPDSMRRHSTHVAEVKLDKLDEAEDQPGNFDVGVG